QVLPLDPGRDRVAAGLRGDLTHGPEDAVGTDDDRLRGALPDPPGGGRPAPGTGGGAGRPPTPGRSGGRGRPRRGGRMRGAVHRGSPASPPASITLALLLALAWASPAWADPAASKNNEGNRLYNQKRYDDALKKYTDAQVSRPDAIELHYNIGNVL